MPDFAPWTLEPDDPILFSTPCSAMGLSDASQEVNDPVALGSSTGDA